jgi:cytidylate kinase
VVVEVHGGRRAHRMFSLSEPIIIAIDGPAGTGKSSVARELARRLGLDFLDTGAMYRAAAAVALDRGIALDEVDELIKAVREADVRFDWTMDPPLILAGGRPMNLRIREQDVTAVVSAYAGVKALRELMVAQQQAIAREHRRLVSEGRDQGSVVFPNAKVKFYLDASPRVRAERRLAQLRDSGVEADLASLKREIEARDTSDKSRAVGPLTCPVDAQSIDTSHLSFEEVVQTLYDHVMLKSAE